MPAWTIHWTVHAGHIKYFFGFANLHQAHAHTQAHVQAKEHALVHAHKYIIMV